MFNPLQLAGARGPIRLEQMARVLTRRMFLLAPLAKAASAGLVLPVRQIIDAKAQFAPGQIQRVWFEVWAEAVRDLASCGIQVDRSQGAGDIWRPPGREPVISGLAPGVINIVVTGRVPMWWDRGRALNGVTLKYRGHHVCVIALAHAHKHRIPLVAVNTCLHELLHALLLDILETRPAGAAGEAREFRIDWHATRMWLLGGDGVVRESAKRYVELLRAETPR